MSPKGPENRLPYKGQGHEHGGHVDLIPEIFIIFINIIGLKSTCHLTGPKTGPLTGDLIKLNVMNTLTLSMKYLKIL